MGTLAKAVFIFLTLSAGFAIQAEPALSRQDYKNIENFFGLGNGRQSTACVGNGYSCNNSFDCCSNWCRDGECYEIGGGCRGNGASCGNSFDCCSNWCRDGKCYEIGGCVPEGGDCERSLDCCSGLSCWRDKCD